MASPFQGSRGVQQHMPSHQSSYPGSQGLVIGSNTAMVPVGVQEGQGGMEAPSGMSQGGIQQPQPPKDFNMALLCRIGQETVQEIVAKTTELFQTLKGLQPPNGTAQSLNGQEERKTKLQENLRTIATCFKKLRRIYEKCNENCATMEYTHIEVDSLVPLKDEIDSRQEDKKPTEAIKYLTEEHRDLVEQVMLQNRQLKEVIDNLR
ncbi:Mediator of RNA polymerase II transcription subunit 30, partial [Stegodyphus mimosarum]